MGSSKNLSFRRFVGGVPQYDFYEFATILQVATIIFYYFILFLLILTCTPEQYTCTSINTPPTTFLRNIRKTKTFHFYVQSYRVIPAQRPNVSCDTGSNEQKKQPRQGTRMPQQQS